MANVQPTFYSNGTNIDLKNRTLWQAPLLLLQAGLVVVVRRELDQESVQSQSTAINVLHALIGQLSASDLDAHWPRGNYIPFDQSEAESLGDGLIDHSAKDLISSLSYMNIHARLRFLLLNAQLPVQVKFRVELFEVLEKLDFALTFNTMTILMEYTE